MPRSNPWLHRCALLLVVLATAVLVAGAFITSTEVAARQVHSTVAPVLHAALHRSLGIALSLLTLCFAVWTSLHSTPRWIKSAAWLGVALLVLSAALGWHSLPLPQGAGFFHALLAHLFLALFVAIAVGTSSRWSAEPECVDGSRRPLLRPLAIAIPPVILLQITLGAAYRHQLTGVMPHLALAMGVVFLALIGASVVLQNFPRPPAMRSAAAALISIVLIQLCLGITTLLLLLLNTAGTAYFVLSSVAHVTVGAAALAVSVILAMEVRRCVLPTAAEQRTQSLDATSGGLSR